MMPCLPFARMQVRPVYVYVIYYLYIIVYLAGAWLEYTDVRPARARSGATLGIWG